MHFQTAEATVFDHHNFPCQYSPNLKNTEKLNGCRRLKNSVMCPSVKTFPGNFNSTENLSNVKLVILPKTNACQNAFVVSFQAKLRTQKTFVMATSVMKGSSQPRHEC